MGNAVFAEYRPHVPSSDIRTGRVGCEPEAEGLHFSGMEVRGEAARGQTAVSRNKACGAGGGEVKGGNRSSGGSASFAAQPPRSCPVHRVPLAVLNQRSGTN